MVFKREVTTVDRVELDLRHVRWRPHAGAREKRVVDAGGDHHLTLVCFEKLPCIGDRLPVVPDIVEEIENDLVDAGASQQGAVDRPIIGVDQRRFARPGDVLIANGVRRQLGPDRVPMRRRTVLPVRQFGRLERATDRLSERRCVLDDNACDAIGVFEHQAVSDGSAEIHHIHGEARDPELLKQRLHHLREMGVRICV
ncbi:MAG: hypothetical protein WAZ97_09705 [Pseudolabrys sp.]